MRTSLIVIALVIFLSLESVAQQPVQIDLAGRPVPAVQWGTGSHAVIAIHGRGGRPDVFGTGLGGDLGPTLARAGFRVIAPAWSGSPSGGEPEMTAAVSWARQTGAPRISLLGHSFGADLAARVAQSNPDGTFDTVVLLALTSGRGITLSKTKKLFVVSDGDTLSMPHARKLAEESSEPKRSVVLPGTGHMIFSLSSATFVLHEVIVEMLSRK
jgi:pimeloyl-ACP methyl ester carboxylesterase